MEKKISQDIEQYKKTALKSAVFFARLKYMRELEEVVSSWKIGWRTINKKILDTMSSFLHIIKNVLWEDEDIWEREIKEVALDVWNYLEENWNEKIWSKIKIIALQIQIICQSHEIKKLQKDGLTWLSNKKLIENYLSEAIEDKKRNNTNYWIIMIDIDHFKSINDQFWHLVWDSVLEELWNIFREFFRWEDKIGRWWWEEFVIIMKWWTGIVYKRKMSLIKNTIETELARRIRMLQNQNTKCDDDYNCNNCQNKWCKNTMANRDITVSIWITSLRENDTVTTAIWRADKWLYEAKNTWRNRVVFKN